MVEPNENNQESILEEAVQQFVDAQLRGQPLDIDEYVRQYPGLEHQVRQRIQNLERIGALFARLTQADDNDFADTATGPDLAGQKIGSFEIGEMIGRGGMGIVYLARDTKLDRSVAIKSMPAELLGDSTARMRFKREAKLLASLNHPNIAVIHETIEQEEGTDYLVLEYVPGETLAERIARKPLELKQAVSIGQQIAEAVSAAHEKGVVHRDLKPGNIKITPDGRVKVLDFGLAKVLVCEGKSGEITETQPGRVIGTPAYMSPEQARGKLMDHRTDIWSFGCIMYQMLTGRLPFEGETATDTLARVIEHEPDWQALPQETPANIRVLLRRCLEKNPHHRLQHIGDAALEISETLSDPMTAPAATIPAKPRRMPIIVGSAIIIVLSGVAIWFALNRQAQPSSKEIRLVVLPFEILGPAEDEYFADGITDAITARLAGIRGLGVISRQSAMQYKEGEESAQEIAKELGVDYVLEGTVQRERPSDPTSRVRIIPQLIRASDNMHVWAETYDDDMSEIFRVQSDLAERVAQALDITLLEPERQALQSRPTKNMEAYDYYLRGNDYFYRGYLENDFRIAIRMYEKAVELDPIFALAYTDLSKVHAKMYWFHYDRSEERLAMAKQAVDEAILLNPELPEAHIALGFYYYRCHLDYDHALEEFAIARKSQPNNSELLKGIGVVQRRQGELKQALANFSKASELDPHSNPLVLEVAQTFMLLRMYPEAERYYKHAISLRPDWSEPYAWMAWLYLLWEGNKEKAWAVFEQASLNSNLSENHFVVFRLVLLNVFSENYKEALAQLSSWKLQAFDSQFHFASKAQLYARISGLTGNKQLEKNHYDSARSILESKIQEDPNDARFHSSLGITYAGLGRKQDAIREGQLAVELLPVSKEAFRGFYRAKDLAQIYVMVGEYDAAINQIEFLLSIPGPLSIPLLRLDPAWAPLRDHPRFKKLMESDK